jgi:hypothetical protein
MLKYSGSRTLASLPFPVRIFWALNVFLSFLCGVIMLGNRYLLHLPYPYNFPALPFRHWIDFWCFQIRFQHFHQLDVFSTSPELSFRFMYPAPMALLYEGFYSFGRYSLVVFLLATAALVLFLGGLLGRAMVRLGISPVITLLFLTSTLVFSFPFWFEYLLGNMEVCIFVLVVFALLAFLHDRFYLSALIIGIAASMKLFPLVYFALLLSRRKYRQFAFGVATAIVMNIVSLWVVCPSLRVAYAGIKSGLAAFRSNYTLRFNPMETGFDHSIFGLIKTLLRHHYDGMMPSHFLTTYMALIVVGGVALYFLRIRRLPLLNQIASLCIASVLLPPTSHDYGLIELYLPWGFLVLLAIQAKKDNIHVPSLLGAFLCFGILFSAQSELIYHRAGRSGQLKAIVLCVLWIISLSSRWTFSNGNGFRTLFGLNSKEMHQNNVIYTN